MALGARTSSVSRRVRQFEDMIGIGLFERTSAGVRLTGAGKQFINEILPALSHIESAFLNAGLAGRGETGTVRIGLLTTLAGGFLPELISAFRAEFKGVDVKLRDGGRNDHLTSIRARKIDLAIVTGAAAIEDCDVAELWRERVHVALPSSHRLAAVKRISWPDIQDERFIVSAHAPGPEVRDFIVRRVADYSTYPQVQVEAVTQATLMHMVELREGVTVVSEGWTSLPYPDLVLKPLVAEEDIVPLSAVWSPHNDNPALRRFISFAKLLAARRRGPGIARKDTGRP